MIPFRHFSTSLTLWVFIFVRVTQPRLVAETASSSKILEKSGSSSNSHLALEIEELQSSTNFVMQSKENLEIAQLETFSLNY